MPELAILKFQSSVVCPNRIGKWRSHEHSNLFLPAQRDRLLRKINPIKIDLPAMLTTKNSRQKCNTCDWKNDHRTYTQFRDLSITRL